jgi:hypothetical protein
VLPIITEKLEAYKDLIKDFAIVKPCSIEDVKESKNKDLDTLD